jgi:hypothetical protein
MPALNSPADPGHFIFGHLGHFLFFPVLRQFKIVKFTRHPGEKTNELLKTKLPLHALWTSNLTKS